MTVAEAVSQEVTAAVDAAIVNAEARVEAAEAVNAAITEAALRDAISERVDDLQEDILSCQESLQSLQVLSSQITGILERLTIVETKVSAPVVVIPEPALTPQVSQETTTTETTVVNPASANAGDLPVQQTQKPRAFRLT